MHAIFRILPLIALIGSLGAANAPSEGAPRTHVVTIDSMTFTPAIVRIAPGDRVTFRNNDFVPHTATSRDTGEFDSGLIKPGASWSVVPTSGKPIRYVCSYHPAMMGRIDIDDATAAPRH